jgi:DNA-binding transcriptional ArsR family regulator
MSEDDAVFRALASSVRRRILVVLREGELPAGDIAARFDLAAPTVSRHLGVLKAAALVAERRDGNRIFYRAEPHRVATTLEHFVGSVTPPRRSSAGPGRRRR